MDRRKRTKSREPDRLYQRNGIWYARITVDGRERRQSLKTDDRKEAERRLTPWLKRHSPYKGTIRHTFVEAADLWFQAGDWKRKTEAGYAKLLKVLLEYFGKRYWDQVDKAALMDFMDWRRQQGSGTATLNRYLTVISGIADHVKELPGWPETNPVHALPRKPRKARRWRYVRPPQSDIDAFFARMRSTFGDLCQFALLTGMRLDEIAQLKRHDVVNGTARLWDTKSHFRTIQLSAAAQAIVDRQPDNKTGHVFITRNGTPYRRVGEMWREIVTRAQMRAQREGRTITRMRFHDLRHEYAIRELESGRNIYLLRDHLGHSTVKQTEEYLRYLTPEQAARAIGRTAH